SRGDRGNLPLPALRARPWAHLLHWSAGADRRLHRRPQKTCPRAARRRARADRGARPLRLLPPALGGARARARDRRRGAWTWLTPAAATARARARQLRRVDRLL